MATHAERQMQFRFLKLVPDSGPPPPPGSGGPAQRMRMLRAKKIRSVAAIDGRERLLKVGHGTPLLSVERIAYTYQNVPMELRRGYYRTDTHLYHNTLN